MPTLSIPTEELCTILSDHGVTVDLEDLRTRLPYIGVDMGRVDEEFEIEVFPDRPDLLSVETLAWTYYW